MTEANQNLPIHINEIILLKLLCERSEQHIASAQASLHTLVGGGTQFEEATGGTLGHTLELMTMELKMLGNYIDYKAANVDF